MYTLYFDGSNKGDRFGCGAAVIYKGKNKEYSKAITLVDQPMSCNVAEYQGLITGLQWLLQNKKENEQIFVFGDSKMVINQMFGYWRIKNGLYKEKGLQCQDLLTQFSDIHGYWIPREQNDEADCLSKKYPASNIDKGDMTTKHTKHYEAFEEHNQRFLASI